MRKKWRKLLILLVLLIPFRVSFGDKLDFGGAAILTQPMGAKEISMGEAFVAVADDLNTIYYNPAGLVQIDKEFSITYLKSFSDTYYTSLSLGKNVQNLGHFGAMLYIFNAGVIELPVDAVNYETVNLENDYLLTLSFSNYLFNKGLSYGVNIKFLQSILLEQYTATSYIADFGLLYKIPSIKGLNVGAAVQNIGTEINYGSVGEPLPTTLRLGLAYRFPGRFNKFRISSDLVQTIGWSVENNYGIEYQPIESFVFRTGYRKTVDNDYFSVGIGFSFSGTSIEYGQTFNTLFDPVNQFTLSFGPKSTWLFGKEEGKAVLQASTETIKEDLLLKTTEQAPVLSKELSEQVGIELEPVFVFIKQGQYLMAKNALEELVSKNDENRKWQIVSDKLAKIVLITAEISKEGLPSEVARKGLLSFLKPAEDPRDALIKMYYAIEKTSDEGDKAVFNKLYIMLQDYYPDLAKTEKIPEGFDLVSYKLFMSLNYIYDGHYDLSIQKTQEVLDLEPDNVLALKRLGSALYALGKAENKPENIEKARKSWGRALELAPDDLEIKEFLKKE